MKHLKKSELTTSTELLRHLRVIYNASNISLRSTNNNLYEITVNGETKKDFAVLKNGEITNGKSTIKYYVIKLT